MPSGDAGTSRTVAIRRVMGWSEVRAGSLTACTVVVVAGGVLLSFSLPKLAIPWLAYVGLAPLLLFCRRATGLRSLWLGWACGMGFYLPLLYWVVLVMEQYGGLPRLASLLVTLLLTAYLACYPALFAFFASLVARRREAWYWGATPFLWVGVEVGRAHAVFGGFPWGELAYSQVPWPLLIQSADLFGTAGLNLLLVTVNGAVAASLEAWFFPAWGEAGSRWWRVLRQPVTLAAVLLFLGNAAYGVVQWSAYAPERQAAEARGTGQTAAAATAAGGIAGGLGQSGSGDTPPATARRAAAGALRLGILQGSVPQGIKWERSYREATLDIYETLSRQARAAGVDLVVWPETALPFDFAAESALRRRFLEGVRESATPTVVGAPTVEAVAGAASGESSRVFNSAYLLSPRAEVLGRYDKQHLVPFGEYVPFSWLFKFASNLTGEIGAFTPGAGVAMMELRGHPFAVLICFEIIFPELARAAARQGAEFFLNLTNDAWFGRTSAPYQHWAMASLRAVETRRPIARAANTGISGWIDRRGGLHAGAGLFERAVVRVTIPPRHTPLTFYVRLGYLFGWLCAAVALGFVLAALWRPRGVSGRR
ncbi:MAG: apolipoprotein N-acyltransferase [Candidatus Tectomicrobia bacterium]|nr:apolipoprotein N-acyltransferase [Candidatus Tectomicrobia bacterium]